MAKGYERSRYQQNVIRNYYEHKDTLMSQKLGEIVSDLYLAEDPKRANRLWESAWRALVNVQADPQRVAKILQQRDLAGLAKLANELAMGQKAQHAAAAESRPHAAQHSEHPETPPAAAVPARAAEAVGPSGVPAAAPTPEQLKSAMKAFRKRLKLTRLDDESKLGHRAMSGGRRSAIVAIMPPREYPKAVWDQLVQQGKLKDAGGGFYELVE